MRVASFLASLTLAVVAAVAADACTVKEPQASTYFDVTIEPILQGSCVHSNTGAGCHVADAKGNAFGNLDLSGYAGVDHRRDLLLDYGPYQNPSLLVKNVAPYQLSLQTWDGTKVVVTTDIKHTGGPILDPTASGFVTLKRWIENGATVNNTGVPVVTLAREPASEFIPAAPGFDPDNDPTSTDFATFKNVANPVLAKSCAAGNCHGTMTNALYLTRGLTPQEIRWNYFAAVDYLAATPPESEILRRPLATSQGGSYHEGGPLFASVNDPSYQSLVQWATAHGPLKTAALDPAFMFFALKVQPILVKKGCMMAQCHSAAMFHDFRLRGGSAGSFSLTATRKNYAFAIAQMSLESDDVNASRLVRKNLYRSDQFADSTGVFHRGAPLLEDFGDNHAISAGPICDQANYDYQNGALDKIPAYCVIREWHRQERMERGTTGLSAIVYVSRPPPPGPDRPQDFDVFAGGASLHIAAASLTATGDVTLGADTAVDLTSCGLGAGADVRRPAVSWDAKTIAFAGRTSASDPLAIYTMNADGTGCAKQGGIAGHPAMGGGLLEHDFDPAFSPPVGGVESIVFASTRGNLDTTAATFDYSGPQRTPEDPTKPNANLYVLEADPTGATKTRVRQLTWQLNMERLPSFMQDGRLVFTTEKRAPGFYQLALRRQNLDGGDYHPLYAQRGTIGYQQATYVVELADKNFATIFSNPNAVHGAGALGVFNRSIGIDFQSSTASNYLVDPSIVNATAAAAPESDFFKHSLTVLPTDGGSYTSPSPLPDGKMLVSFGSGAPASFGGDYDLYVLDPSTGAKTKLLGGAGTAEIEAVAVYPRTDKGVFTSAPDEPNGHTSIASGVDPTRSASADVTVLDMTVLASLLFQNTPTGRVVEPDLQSFQIYEDLPPDVSTFPGCGGNTACDAYGKVYVRRRLLGSVPVLPDGSAHFRVPGGLPIVLRLADDSESQRLMLPRWQREEMTFLPGETAHQSFQAGFFDNLCAGCHGAISGRPLDAALRPDFLTQASDVAAASGGTSDYSGPPSTRRSPVIGPPSPP